MEITRISLGLTFTCLQNKHLIYLMRLLTFCMLEHKRKCRMYFVLVLVPFKCKITAVHICVNNFCNCAKVVIISFALISLRQFPKMVINFSIYSILQEATNKGNSGHVLKKPPKKLKLMKSAVSSYKIVVCLVK